MVRSSVKIEQIPKRFPTKTANLCNCAGKEQKFRPIYFVLSLIFLKIVVDKDQSRCNDKGNNIPVIFFFSNLSIVIQYVEFDIHRHISIVVVIDKSTLTVLKDEIMGLVIVDAKCILCCCN